MAVKIKLKSENGKKFYFSVMPEEIHMKSAAKYQTFDVIRDGAVKVPNGMEVDEISWDGEFFGKPKRKESIVNTDYWKKPADCIDILQEWMEKGKVLTLIVSKTCSLNISSSKSFAKSDSACSMSKGSFERMEDITSRINSSLLSVISVSYSSVSPFSHSTDT